MTAYYNEFDPYAAQWLRNLIAGGLIAPGDVDERSITEVSPDDLKAYTQCHFFAGIGGWSLAARLAGWPDNRPLWTGSCPCQPFSAAGKQKGFSDHRHLWPEFYRLIADCRPHVVFGEQVAGKDGVGWAEQVSADLKSAEYVSGFFVFQASEFGAPQKRERIYFAADVAISDAGGRAADVWRHGRLQPVEACPWSLAPWIAGNADACAVDDGLPAQLVKSCLRGFGNAIIPQVAAEVIAAFMEITGDQDNGI